MARFYLGQRVRFVRFIGDPLRNGYADVMAQVGKEGIVNDLDCSDTINGPPMIGTKIGDEDWCFLPEELEPITDSSDLVSWESMRDLWVPEHLRVQA